MTILVICVKFYIITKYKKNTAVNEDTKQFIAQHRTSDTRTLALQATRHTAVDMRQAITQIEGWQLAQSKLPQWAATEGVIYPPRISMEQCSSQATALYKASLASGARIADLTGGFGIDCSYMARGFEHTTYIERNPLLCDIARENFKLLGLHHIDIVNGNSEDILATLPPQDWIFADPARRDGAGQKVVALADCEPDITAIEEDIMAKSKRAMIKCSPMLDITAACRQLKHVAQVHIIAVNNECKELLFILQAGGAAEITTHCINITNKGTEQFTFTAAEEQNATASYTAQVGAYLYEPNAAIQKGNSHKTLAAATGTSKLHPNSHLFTADTLIEQFPGRKFKVAEVLGFTKSDIKKVVQMKKANISVRNFPESVQQLRKRLKLSDGGNEYIFATTLADERKVLIACHRA